jgi:hypothetical protein
MVESGRWRLGTCLFSGWLLLAASCADEPLPPTGTAATSSAAPPVASLPPLPRSSIAAVVLRRQELGLSDDQVRDLELRDQQREKEDAAVRDEAEEKRKAAEARTAPSAGGGGGAGNGSGGPSGGMRGGGMGRRGSRGGGSSPPAHVITESSIEDRMDANDTKAYLDAESASLTEGQKDRAREIASEYREKLYERRELLRAQAAAK